MWVARRRMNEAVEVRCTCCGQAAMVRVVAIEPHRVGLAFEGPKEMKFTPHEQLRSEMTVEVHTISIPIRRDELKQRRA